MSASPGRLRDNSGDRLLVFLFLALFVGKECSFAVVKIQGRVLAVVLEKINGGGEVCDDRI